MVENFECPKGSATKPIDASANLFAGGILPAVIILCAPPRMVYTTLCSKRAKKKTARGRATPSCFLRQQSTQLQTQFANELSFECLVN